MSRYDTVTSGRTESRCYVRHMSDRKETAGEEAKRKRGLNDDVSCCRKKAREGVNGGDQKTIATEEEVDEFYAILRRIHVAVSYFEKKNGGGCKLTEDKLGLIGAAVEREDGDEVNGGGNRGEVLKMKEGVEETVGFDLNLNPVS